MADDVKAYLEELQNTADQTSTEEEKQNELLDEAKDDDFHTISEEDLQTDENPFPEPDLTPDNTFTIGMGNANPIFTTSDGEYTGEITEDDKSRYLRALLQDKAVVLSIGLYGDKLRVACRNISTYEYQLADLLGMKLFETHSVNTARALLPMKLHTWRMAMQILQINGIPREFLEFKPEVGKLQEHLDALETKSEELIGTMSTSLYNACRSALNIFHHKLTKLDQLALARDFTTPVG